MSARRLPEVVLLDIAKCIRDTYIPQHNKEQLVRRLGTYFEKVGINFDRRRFSGVAMARLDEDTKFGNLGAYSYYESAEDLDIRCGDNRTQGQGKPVQPGE